MSVPVFALIGLGILAPAVSRWARGWAGWVLAAGPWAAFLFYLARLRGVGGSGVMESTPWLPSLGVDLAWRLDGLSLTFSLLICLVGGVVVLHASGYLAGDRRRGRFLAYLFLFLGSMLGLVLSDHLLLLFVFWELTGISSFLLIGHDHENDESRRSATKALLVTGAGGLALLAAFLMMILAAGQLAPGEVLTGRISELTSVDLRDHGLYVPILILLALGAFTKSAQAPFHFWLPAAMAAPTPVSALLHSATMVKAGVYLLARLHPALGDTLAWEWILIPAGAVTMVLGAVLATAQRDLKRILAYTTVSVLGTLTMLIGAGTEYAVKAAVVLLVAHALYKAALFLVAANVDHETGTRDVTLLGGLRRLMPITAATGVLAALSNAGSPPLFGFFGKEMLYKAKLDIEVVGAWLVSAAVVANILLVAMALVVAIWPFFGPRKQTPKAPHEAPPSMLLGPAALAVLGLFIGLFPGAFDTHLGSGMASAILGRTVRMELKLWHGVSTEALMLVGLSVLTLGAGFALFLKLRPMLAGLGAGYRYLGRLGPARAYEAGLSGLTHGAAALTRAVQSGYLRRYLLVFLIVWIAAVALPLIPAFAPSLPPGALDVGPLDVALLLLVAAGAVVTVRVRSRIVAVTALGATGIGVALTFALFGAPDLAVTQIFVETLTVILLVILFRRLPPFSNRSSRLSRAGHAVLAGVAGATLTGLLLAAAAVRLPGEVSEFLARASVPDAYGRNVVNVILVDFRALDTLGEITVLAVAGFGVFALLRLREAARERKEAP